MNLIVTTPEELARIVEAAIEKAMRPLAVASPNAESKAREFLSDAQLRQRHSLSRDAWTNLIIAPDFPPRVAGINKRDATRVAEHLAALTPEPAQSRLRSRGST